MKITPAHDINDKAIGDRHNLQIIDIFNEDATLNSYGLHHQGKSRIKAREDIFTELKAMGLIVKTEDILQKLVHQKEQKQ